MKRRMKELEGSKWLTSDEYRRLRGLISHIETVDEAIRILSELDTTVQVCRWVEVDIVYHFKKNLPSKLSQLLSYLKLVLNRDDAYIYQLQKVAEVFGEEEKRFPFLSFWHHVILAYSLNDLTEEEMRSLAQQAIAHYWSVNELRLRVKTARREKVLAKQLAKEKEAIEGKAEEIAGKDEEETEKQPSIPLPKEEATAEEEIPVVDIASDLETSKELRRQERLQKWADIFIRLTEAYLWSKKVHDEEGFFNGMFAAFGNLWWEFIANLLKHARYHVDVARFTPADIDVLLKAFHLFAGRVMYVEKKAAMEASREEESDEMDNIPVLE